MKIKKILLILALLSMNLYSIKAQEDKPREKEELEKQLDISTIPNDMKMLISNLLLTNEGSLKNLFSYLSVNKELAKFAKYNYFTKFIINYINGLDSGQQKIAFRDIIETLKNKEYRDAKVALDIIKELCDRGIIEKLVDNIVTSETATADILNYFPIDKEVNKLIKKK